MSYRRRFDLRRNILRIEKLFVMWPNFPKKIPTIHLDYLVFEDKGYHDNRILFFGTSVPQRREFINKFFIPLCLFPGFLKKLRNFQKDWSEYIDMEFPGSNQRFVLKFDEKGVLLGRQIRTDYGWENHDGINLPYDLLPCLISVLARFTLENQDDIRASVARRREKFFKLTSSARH